MTALRLCLLSPLVFVVLMLSAKVCRGTLATSSTIQSPNFPNSYPNNREVIYNITATEGFQVTLNFSTFDLEVGPTCFYDYVEIRDGGSETSALIGRYCNIPLPFAVRSSGNQMLVKFVTDGSINKSGFRATHTSDYPGTIATSSTIQSPNFPNNYLNNWNVRYNITVTEGFQITLNFTTFDLEAHRTCSHDYVEIRDGSSETSALIGRYCSTLGPFTVRSSGNQMLIKFVSDGSINQSGFRATHTTDSAKTTVRTTYASEMRVTATEYAMATPSTDSKATQSSMAATTIATSTEILTTTTNPATSSTDATTISTAYTSPKRSTTSTTTTITTATPTTILTLPTAIPFSTTSSATASHTDAATVTTATPSTTITSPTAIPTSTTRTATASNTDATITTARPSTTNIDSTAATTSNTNAVASTVHVVTTSEELPFDTDGSQNLTLSCRVDKVSQVTGYRWSVACRRQTGNTCVFLPQPEDDGKLVTCTVTFVHGGSATGDPPHTTPVIEGYTKGEVLKAGDDLRITCSVHGGKPLVRDVIFSCDGHPDTAPDITGQTEVQSAVQFTPLTTEDDGKRCTCTAEWKNTDWYFLSATTILRVNATMKRAIEDQGEPSIPAIAGGVGVVVVVILIVVVVVVVAVIRRRNGQHDYDRPEKTENSTQDPASPHPGLAPLDGQPFVVSVDGTADNNRSSQYAEIGEASDAPPVPSRRQLSPGSTDSYIQPITEPEHDYIECIGP